MCSGSAERRVPESELQRVLERLVRPRDLLVGVEQRPHVVARDLPARIGAHVAGGVGLRQQIADRSDFEVAWQRVDFYGLCPRCAAAKRRGELSEV